MPNVNRDGPSTGTNTTAIRQKIEHVILRGVLKQKQSKCMDMIFYWLRDRFIEQKKNSIHTENAKNTTYETIQKNTTQINIIELFSPSM